MKSILFTLLSCLSLVRPSEVAGGTTLLLEAPTERARSAEPAISETNREGSHLAPIRPIGLRYLRARLFRRSF